MSAQGMRDERPSHPISSQKGFHVIRWYYSLPSNTGWHSHSWAKMASRVQVQTLAAQKQRNQRLFYSSFHPNMLPLCCKLKACQNELFSSKQTERNLKSHRCLGILISPGEHTGCCVSFFLVGENILVRNP